MDLCGLSLPTDPHKTFYRFDSNLCHKHATSTITIQLNKEDGFVILSMINTCSICVFATKE